MHTRDFPAIKIHSLCVTQTPAYVNICLHTLFFHNYSHKPPDINILKYINMTIHKCAHSSNVVYPAQEMETVIHVGHCTLIYLLGHTMDNGCDLTNETRAWLRSNETRL